MTESQIASWADPHHRRTGEWPTHRFGPIDEAPGETWCAVEGALFQGVRGLPGGPTLSRLLSKHRSRYNPHELHPLSTQRVLACADPWHARMGRWPTATDGTIPEAGGMTRASAESALRGGRHGLPGGSSLARLLAAEREVCNRGDRPPYTEGQIVACADVHRRRTGSGPTISDGPIAGTHIETWKKVDLALRNGHRGLKGGSSLGRLLAKQRGVKAQIRPALDEGTNLAWADGHHDRTGTWPGSSSGALVEAPGETWSAIDAALIRGRRGLAGGSPLARLLFQRRRVRIHKHPPRLDAPQILSWADAFHARTGTWPTVRFGAIPDAPGKTGRTICDAHYHGDRGLPAGSSLARLLAEQRGVRNRSALPRLSIPQIVQWCEE